MARQYLIPIIGTFAQKLSTNFGFQISDFRFQVFSESVLPGEGAGVRGQGHSRYFGARQMRRQGCLPKVLRTLGM
jgi:hypothetical protein